MLHAKKNDLRPESLLLLAEHDRIISNEPTLEWFRRVAGARGSAVKLADAAHTLEFDQDRTHFREVLECWSANPPQVQFDE